MTHNGTDSSLAALRNAHDSRQCLAIRSGPNGRGLFVRRDVKPGETLLVLPARALLNVKSAVMASLLPSDVLPSSEHPSHPQHWTLFRDDNGDAGNGSGSSDVQGGPALPLTSVQCLTLVLARWRAQARSRDFNAPINEDLDALLRSYPDSYPGMPLTWRLVSDPTFANEELSAIEGNGVEASDVPTNEAAARLAAELLYNLPPHIAKAAQKVEMRFLSDVRVIADLCAKRPEILQDSESPASLSLTKEDLVWAWSGVNSRCVYLSLGLKPHGDNFTLAPLLDMANHTDKPWRESKVRCLPAKVLELKAPTALREDRGGYKAGDEVFLSYGAHSNSALLTEYGFCIPHTTPTHTESGSSWSGNAFAEVNVDHLVVDLFVRQGEQGQSKMRLLRQEGYWLDYTIHPHPAPAYPSHRLVTALRLLVIDLEQSPDIYNRISESALVLTWRATVRGMRQTVSAENESQIRALLAGDAICGRIKLEAEMQRRAVEMAKEQFVAQQHKESDYSQTLGYGINGSTLLSCASTVQAVLDDEISCASRLCNDILSGQSEW